MSTTAMNQTQRRTFQLGKARPTAVIGRSREPGELILLIAAGACALVFALVLPWLPIKVLALIGFPAAAGVMVFAPYKGRTPYRWFEIGRTYRRLLSSGRGTWRNGAPEAGTHLDGQQVEVGAPPGVGRLRWLAAPFDGAEVAVLLHLDRRLVTVGVEIDGPGVGSRDAEDQEALVDRFGALLAHVANGDGFVRRLQMLARTLPADPQAHARDVEQRGNPHAPDWLQNSYDDLLGSVSTSSEQHRNYLIAALPYSRELAAEALTYGKGDGGLATVAARELGDIVRRLADADITVRQPLGIGATASLIHALYDPDHPIDNIAGMTRRGAWPAELDATQPQYLQAKTRESDTAESWCHATAWITTWPSTPVGVNFLAPLLVQTPDVIRTVAVTMELEATDVAIERMLAEKTNDQAETSRTAKLHRTTDPRDSAHSGRLDQRGEDLAGGAAGVNLVGYVTVSARTPDDLARDKRTVRAAAGKAYLRLEWCDREHHRAHTNTLPFAAGLTPR